MTLVVLAIEALDSVLIKDFGVDALELKTAHRMKAMAHMRDEPYIPDAWELMWHEGQTDAEFRRDILGLNADQFRWVGEMLNHDVAVAGVLIYLLDAAGHAYCDDRTRLRAIYKRAGGFIAELCSELDDEDDLLILSDHGIVVEWYRDKDDRGESPGSHSWCAFSSSTRKSAPRTAPDVPQWVDQHGCEIGVESQQLDIEEQQLRDFGYI